MAKVTFSWTIAGPDQKENDLLEAEIVAAFVEGYQGEFIQEVLGGNVMLLSQVTDAEKKAFAIYKLTQQNLSSIQAQQIEKQIMAARAVAATQAKKHELPKIIRKAEGGQ